MATPSITIKDSTLKPFDIPLSGKLRKDVDPLYLSPGDFRELINCRYTVNGIKGVMGQTKINSAAAFTSLRVDSGFHFLKDQPGESGTKESHVFVQTSNNGVAPFQLLKSNAILAVPGVDTFSSFVTPTTSAPFRFSTAPDGSMIAFDGKKNYVWGGNEIRCSKFVVYDPSDTFWYDYTFRIRNTLTDAQNVASMTPVGGACYAYVGSVRPISGVKFTISTPGVACTVTAYYWNGTTWAACTGIVDGTAGMTITGEISFDSTVATAKVKYLRDSIAYYYKFVFTGLTAATKVSCVTLNAPVQEIVDIWDGSPRTVLSAFKLTSEYSDYIMNVLKEEYFSLDETTYAQAGALTAAQYFYFGFSEAMMGMAFVIPDANYVNKVAATTMIVDYWNGTSWISVGTLDDGTSTGGIAWNHTGITTWQQVSPALEFPTSVASLKDSLFIYRVHFDKTLSADVRLDCVTGIPAQTVMKPHRFALNWQNRIWLCCETSQFQNSAWASAYGTISVFNGGDSTIMTFGDGQPIIAAQTLFTRYGGNLYDNAIFFKRSGIFLVDGVSPQDWKPYTISEDVGLVAPQTLQKCDMSYNTAPGITKHVLIWQSARGIEFFDGNAIDNISDDIKCFFDPGNAEYINTSIVDQFGSYYDEKNYEYHWLFATGTSTVLNKEFAYDLRKKKWFEIDRGTGKRLRVGWKTEDPKGNKFVYAGGVDGYIYRLENGTNFDGNDITHTVHTSDINVAGSMCIESKVRAIYVVGKANNTSTNNVTITLYKDGNETGRDLESFSQASTKRNFHVKRGIGENMVTMSIKLTVSTDDVSVGFEPILISGLFEPLREAA